MRLPRPVFVVLALGVNLWATVDLVPALYSPPAGLALFLLPLPLLVLGKACHPPRDALLFGAFPAVLALSAAAQPQAEAALLRPAALALAIAALVGYLFGAAHAAARAQAPPAAPLRRLDPVVPPRRSPSGVAGPLCAGLALAVPALLLHAALLRPNAARDLAQAYPNRPGAAAAILGAAAILWTGLFVVYVLPMVVVTPAQDRQLRAELRALGVRARRARPGPLFYVAAALGVLAMAALAWLRYR